VDEPRVSPQQRPLKICDQRRDDPISGAINPRRTGKENHACAKQKKTNHHILRNSLKNKTSPA
jgi:hypothetical protein